MPPPYWMIRIYVEPNTKFKNLDSTIYTYIYIHLTYSIIYITPRNWDSPHDLSCRIGLYDLFYGLWWVIIPKILFSSFP